MAGVCNGARTFNVQRLTFIVISPGILPLCGNWQIWSNCNPCSLVGVKCDVHSEASVKYWGPWTDACAAFDYFSCGGDCMFLSRQRTRGSTIYWTLDTLARKDESVTIIILPGLVTGE